MMKIRRMFLLTLMVCLLGCWGRAIDVIAEPNTRQFTPEAPPDTVPPISEPTPTNEKGYAWIGDYKTPVGYDQVPVMLDSYGIWRDAFGKKVTRKQVREFFKDLPDYGYAVMRFNEDLTELMTDERTRVLTKFQGYVAPAKEPVDQYFMNVIEEGWERLKESKELLELISPKANGAYELYNEILKLKPESVPLYQKDGDWYDQDAQKMNQKEARAWFEKHPECALVTQAINDAFATIEEMPILPDTLRAKLRRSFREAYVEACRDANATKSDVRAFLRQDHYKWWKMELLQRWVYDGYFDLAKYDHDLINSMITPEKGKE